MVGVSRRRALGMGVAALAVAGCGANSGRPAGGAGKVALGQWYHQYGEAAMQQAVEQYAQAYPDATVSVQWSLGNPVRRSAGTVAG